MRYSDYLNQVAVRHRTASFNDLTRLSPGAPQPIDVSFKQAIGLLWPYTSTRIMEQVSAVVPLAAYLMLFQLFVLQQPIEAALTLCLGLVAVIVGLAVFMEGLNTGLMPFGTIIGDNLPKKATMGVVLLIIGILGVGVTFAEPAIGALQAFGASVDVTKAPYLYELLNNWTMPLVLMVGGGVGIAALEIGKVMGARVIAAASSPEKLAVCREHGADEVIDYSQEDLKSKIKELTGGKGADVVYDPVGGDYTEPALRAMAWEGRFLVIGFAAGPIPTPPLNLTLLKSCDIVGVFWGAFVGREPQTHAENVAELFTWYEEGRIKPRISAEYPLEEVASALRDLSERRVKGKVVLIP